MMILRGFQIEVHSWAEDYFRSDISIFDSWNGKTDGRLIYTRKMLSKLMRNERKIK